MATKISDKDFAACHAMFDRDHGRLRAELLDSLPDAPGENTFFRTNAIGTRLRRIGILIGAAAAVMIALGLLNIFAPLDNSPMDSIVAPVASVVTPQAAWAEAVQRAGQVSSMHMIMTTPSTGGENSSVELWWRVPHDFRMEFSTGLVMTGNRQRRCTVNPERNLLTIFDATGPGLEMAVLGEVGMMFASPYSLSRQWLEDAEVVSAEDTFYRGEQCRRITVQRDNGRYEYIIDKNTNMIYQGIRYSGVESDRVLCSMEVIAVDQELSDALFSVEATEEMQVNDRRLNLPDWQ
ncbi:MAG: hypothetical protein JW936_00060 [Sedimentisphaerales bacterium]|nr:hypothetical protein [Sedimentisphaerales bacterium]